jgi:hypothetical protein
LKALTVCEPLPWFCQLALAAPPEAVQLGSPKVVFW